MDTYVKKATHVSCIVKETFNPGGLTASVLNGDVCLLKVLEISPDGRSSLLSETIAPPRTIQKLLFSHTPRYLYFRISEETLHDTGVIKSGSRIGLVVQKLVKAWHIHIPKNLNLSLSDAVMTYMLLDGVVQWFFVIISPSDGLAPLGQLRTADAADAPTKPPKWSPASLLLIVMMWTSSSDA